MIKNNKEKSEFRDYVKCPNYVIDTYRKNHKYQTVSFVKEQINNFCTNFNKEISIWDAIDSLNNIVDESDPDIDLHQTHHAFQTAECLRKMYPELDWLHLVGLIHDLGKVLILPQFGNLPQWCVVGDTFPVGCQFSNKIVFSKFFDENEDSKNPKYNTKFGIYEEKCGLDELLFSFGHDEYLYQVLKFNKCKIPELGLKIIRYHSFYPWHKNNEYEYFMNDGDYLVKEFCKKFSECDLYTKDNDNKIDMDKLKPYYESLIKKYFLNETLKF